MTPMCNFLEGARRLAAALLLFLLAACASTLVRHSFGFDASEEPGVEILDYRYGDSRLPSARAEYSQHINGRVRQAASIDGDILRPELLYVRWRDATSGKVYEDTVDLKRLLPRDITDHRIHFTVRGSQLFVFLITPQRREPGDRAVGPIAYRDRKVITLAADFGREVSGN